MELDMNNSAFIRLNSEMFDRLLNAIPPYGRLSTNEIKDENITICVQGSPTRLVFIRRDEVMGFEMTPTVIIHLDGEAFDRLQEAMPPEVRFVSKNVEAENLNMWVPGGIKVIIVRMA